jgi:hypothetical protein
MVRPAAPLPGVLQGRPFSVAEGLGLGMSRGRLRGRDLTVPTTAVRSSSEPRTVLEQAAAFAEVLPSPWAFSHLTAARLLRWPMASPWRPDEPLHVLRRTDDAELRRRGVVFHRGLELRDVVLRAGLPVVTPAETWCDVAPHQPFDQRVVLGDAVVNAWTGIPWPELSAAVERRAGRRGVRALRLALPLIRTRSRSPQETRVRLALAAAGLPEPELNAVILDEYGEWLSESDFVWRQQRVVLEYDGDHHRTDPRQWRSDQARRRVLAGHGWRLHIAIADDLAGPLRLQRLLDAVARDLDL